MIGKQCLVRTYSAGVHFGTLISFKKQQVVLSSARRIWSWRGANTLNEIATNGIDEGASRVSAPVDEILLTEAIEIIPMTDRAVQSLGRCKWAKR